MSRYFTLGEALRLIPEIAERMQNIADAKLSQDAAAEELRKLNSRIQMMGGSLVHPGETIQMRSRKEAAALVLKMEIDNLQSYGCLVKDLDLGLVDFPTLYHGEEVYLCWKRGETAIEYWHGVSEGYRGRKPIDDEFIANHRGGVQ